MIQSVNRRQSLEVFLTIVMSVALLLNINSLANGVGSTASQLQLGTHAQNAVGLLADAGDSLQGVTEGGFVQSLVGMVTGGLGTTPSESESEVATNDSTNSVADTASGEGNIGEWIKDSGTWFLSLFSPGESTWVDQLAANVGQLFSDSSEPVSQVGEEFDRLSRPVVANAGVETNVLEQLKDVQQTMATMIYVW